MIDDAAKANLYNYLKHEREAVLAKLDGLSDYDVRRPLTVTGTNLLGLVKHLATWEARYLGEVFDRPFPEPLPRWDVEAERLADMWANERESRSDIIDRYRRVWEHSDATVDALTLDATGRVAWWQDADPCCAHRKPGISRESPADGGSVRTPTSCTVCGHIR